MVVVFNGDGRVCGLGKKDDLGRVWLSIVMELRFNWSGKVMAMVSFNGGGNRIQVEIESCDDSLRETRKGSVRVKWAFINKELLTSTISLRSIDNQLIMGLICYIES